MRKIKKIALAVLYLLQILVICREPAEKIYDGLTETVEPGNTPVETIQELREIFSRAWHNQIDAYRTSLAHTLPHRGPLTGEAIEHERHTPEDNKSETTKRHRRKLFKEYVIRNLWPATKHFALPAGLPETVTRPLSRNHLAFSAAC